MGPEGAPKVSTLLFAKLAVARLDPEEVPIPPGVSESSPELTEARLILPPTARTRAPLRISSPPTSETCCPGAAIRSAPVTRTAPFPPRNPNAEGAAEVSTLAPGLTASKRPVEPSFT